MPIRQEISININAKVGLSYLIFASINLFQSNNVVQGFINHVSITAKATVVICTSAWPLAPDKNHFHENT